MKSGVSRCFYSLEDLREHYIQSVYALKLGKLLHDERNVFLYEDYAIFHVVEACSAAGDLKKYCHPSLLKLIEYDKQNNTSFVQTLAKYVYNSKNVAETANDLHIHRNTILYRIEKISEIMNVDLTNSNIILQLHFSFKIIEYENKCKIYHT
ncbi:MAG: helix-turn-helix domain-containing protein [Clostridiales bacterium]|nr:helix-turn-helix domain-containing protein [Eubacteriales bacterium]MDH7567442.1 helix-turn-helix domain-containing protein [Clostridiales bacterium]